MDANVILEQCILEEEKYQFPSFSGDDVWDLGCCLVEAARATGKPLAAEIVLNGTLVFRYYPAGTGKANERWLGYERNTVEDTQKSSLRVFAEMEVSGKTLMDELMDPMKYAACGGGFPLRIKGGYIIGFIGTSGLPHLQDHAALIDGLERYFKLKGWG